MTFWYESATEAWADLSRSVGRFGLITGAEANTVAAGLADATGAVPLNVGMALTRFEHAPSPTEVFHALDGHRVLNGIEILLDPVLGLSPLDFLRSLSHFGNPIIAVWPGKIIGSTVTWGTVGHRGYIRADTSDLLVFTTGIPTVFSDQPPFTVTRIP